MKQVAKFEKVSFDQFKTVLEQNTKFTEEEIKKVYDDIKLPKRATTGSAGYDFYMPYSVVIGQNESRIIYTGIRCKLEEGYVLQLYPRSSIGIKRNLNLKNTVGIVDSDYYNADNEGHIMVALRSTGPVIINGISYDSAVLDKGEAFVQGIFMPYYITYDDEVSEQRTGGIGSTSN